VCEGNDRVPQSFVRAIVQPDLCHRTRLIWSALSQNDIACMGFGGAECIGYKSTIFPGRCSLPKRSSR